jgi:hypothetical protein
MKIKPTIENELKNNITRNQQIYKKAEIKEEQIPPVSDPPAQYIIKLN